MLRLWLFLSVQSNAKSLTMGSETTASLMPPVPAAATITTEAVATDAFVEDRGGLSQDFNAAEESVPTPTADNFRPLGEFSNAEQALVPSSNPPPPLPSGLAIPPPPCPPPPAESAPPPPPPLLPILPPTNQMSVAAILSGGQILRPAPVVTAVRYTDTYSILYKTVCIIYQKNICFLYSTIAYFLSIE